MIDEEKLETIRSEHQAMHLRMQLSKHAEATDRLMNLPDDEIRHMLDKYYDSPEGQEKLVPKLKG